MGSTHSRKKLDLTGARFGSLTAVAPARNLGDRTAWLCRCDCGREMVVKTAHLRAGKVGSCGCADGRPGELAPRYKADGKTRKHPEGLASLHYVDGTCVEMLRKNTVRSNNTSGVPGVDWRKDKRRWRAMICFKGKRVYLGQFKEFEDAVAARKSAEAALHGAFLKEYAAGETL